ncbi:MAG: DNA polymerase IV, partial [Halorubrum sp.]
ETVSALAADVARRARERGCLYRTVGIKAVEPPFDVNTRARSLPGPVDDPALVEEVALDLLGEFDDARVRKLGVRVSKLDFAETDQATLGGFEAGDGDGDRERRGGRRDRSDRVDGGKLTDWIDGPPGRGDDDGDGSPGDRDRRRTDAGQASLGDWE